MRCDRSDIQELLPAYLEQRLPETEQKQVSLHIAACPDCSRELMVLRALADEQVPDPGEAFWAALPDKVHREVRLQQERKQARGLPGLLGRFRAPRWAWAAATAVLLAVVAWQFLRPVPLQLAGKQLPDAGGLYVDVLASDQVRIAELSSAELDSLDAWASTELAPLQEGVVDMFMNAPDGAIEERLAEMNAQELERLSSMLDAEDEEV